MCGIVGMVAFSARGASMLDRMDDATACLARRGPDHGGVFRDGDTGLGHRRLAVIDTSDAANQPMTDESGRYTIVYNGEAYNFRELRDEVRSRGHTLRTQSDTEVVLRLFIDQGPAMVARLNGFFAFAVFDRAERSLFLARDRFGIKPLFVYRDDDALIFASGLKAILAFPVPRELDEVSLLEYLQLSYVPAPHSILRRVSKLEPGCCMTVRGGNASVRRYVALPAPGEPGNPAPPYHAAQRRLHDLLDAAVARQLVSDVPLGAFLSGGVDSAIIAALAARHSAGLETYSIGFPDHASFDESAEAARTARELGVRHTVFPVTEDDLCQQVGDVLDDTDEPFSDSSAIAVHILCRHVRSRVTVALSGDGADELFGGYYKHLGEYTLRRGGARARLVRSLAPVWSAVPGSRESALGNMARRLDRFARYAGMEPRERYWRLCSFTDEATASAGLAERFRAGAPVDRNDEYLRRKAAATAWIRGDADDMNDVLRADMALVLPNDMLMKVDARSMAHGLEVRVPFLDNEVVDFVMRLPSRYKIDARGRKLILRDALRGVVPGRVLTRPKHGFEVPLLSWFRTRLRPLIRDDLLHPDFVAAQGIFDPSEIAALLDRLDAPRPGDITPRVWNLVVFQRWWQRFMA